MSNQHQPHPSTLSQPAPDSVPERTPHQQAQEDLRHSEEKYRRLFETMDTGFAVGEVMRDETGKMVNYRLTQVNPAFEKLTGLQANQAVGKPILEVLPGLDVWWLDTYQQVVDSGQTVHVEAFLPQLNRWYEVTAFQYGKEQFAAYYNDITPRKRQQANLAFLAEVSQDLVGLTTITETMNALGAKIGGYFKASRCAFFEFNETMDEAVCEYDWHRADLPDLGGTYRTADFYTAEFGQTMRTGKAFVLRDREADSRVDAQSLAALHIASLIVIPIVTNQPSLFVLSINDTVPRDWHEDEIELMRELTSRIWTRLERARAEEALRESDRRKSEFLAMLAHELRNPMATLHNTLLLLGLTQGQDETLPLDKALGMMTREVTHLNRMIDDLLDTSRISQGKIHLNKERLDLGTLIRQALEAARSQFASRQQALSIHLPTGPLWVDGDHTRLTQVVRNLTTNAAKYAPDGGQIRVSLEKERGQAVLRIRDNGIGIAPEQLRAIFEVFVQVSSSLDRPQGGLGLGLAVAKQLIELHGGRIEVHSPGLGQGSEFTVHVPSLPDELPHPSSASGDDGRARQAERILVVDDNANLALTTAMLLRHQQYEAHTCLSGPEALAAVELLQPAAVLLDLGMPGMDGFETCRRLRALHWGQHGVIVALSGYGQEEDKQRTRESGFDGHLVKPLHLQTLTALLGNLLNTNEPGR